MAQWKQRQLVPLKVGDKAYFFSGWKSNWNNWGKPEIVTITGECDEGDGYTAWSEEYKAQYAIDHPDHPDGEPDSDDPDWKPGSIHTCNGWLCKTHKEARAKSVEIAKEMRKNYAEKQRHASQVVQYLDWVIARGGRHG